MASTEDKGEGAVVADSASRRAVYEKAIGVSPSEQPVDLVERCESKRGLDEEVSLHLLCTIFCLKEKIASVGILGDVNLTALAGASAVASKSRHSCT